MHSKKPDRNPKLRRTTVLRGSELRENKSPISTSGEGLLLPFHKCRKRGFRGPGVLNWWMWPSCAERIKKLRIRKGFRESESR
ncbi:hypothetical protein DIPPA_18795, partial [Diplonema papillatum]